MSVYKIEFSELCTWVQKRVEKLPKSKIYNGNIILNCCQNILEELRRNRVNEPEGNNFPMYFISSSDVKFPAALALQLLMIKRDEINDCLQYHSDKFESNESMAYVNFERFFEICLNDEKIGLIKKERRNDCSEFDLPKTGIFKCWGIYLGFSISEIIRRQDEINNFFEKTKVQPDGLTININFNNFCTIDKVINELKQYVYKQSYSSLK